MRLTGKMHECNMRFCENCKQNRDRNHLSYMRPLKDMLSSAGDKVLYIFYDFENTLITTYSDKSTLHVRDLVCSQNFCECCEDVEDGDSVRCGKREHSFWDVRFGDMLTYLSEPRPWANKIVAF